MQKELADSLNLIAEKGRSAFYEGDLAQRIVSHLQNNGSYMTIDDFKAHRGEWAALYQVIIEDTVCIRRRRILRDLPVY